MCGRCPPVMIGTTARKPDRMRRVRCVQIYAVAAFLCGFFFCAPIPCGNTVFWFERVAVYPCAAVFTINPVRKTHLHFMRFAPAKRARFKLRHCRPFLAFSSVSGTPQIRINADLFGKIGIFRIRHSSSNNLLCT